LNNSIEELNNDTERAKRKFEKSLIKCLLVKSSYYSKERPKITIEDADKYNLDCVHPGEYIPPMQSKPRDSIKGEPETLEAARAQEKDGLSECHQSESLLLDRVRQKF
jgi:hypothetical protein